MHERQLLTLELASRLQYFTINHLFQAGIYVTKTTSTAKVHLRDLHKYGFLSQSHYGVSRGLGRLPALHGLTPKAVRYLVEEEGLEPEKIKASKSNKNQDYEKRAPADYFHRVGLLDSVLSLLLMLKKDGKKEDFLELYFRRFGMHESRRTTIELPSGRLEPDAVLTFDGKEKKRFFLIEFFEDSTNTERAKRSLIRHGEAIQTGAPTHTFGLNIGHRVLCIFRHEHTARAVMAFVRENKALRPIADGFLFKTHESIVKDPLDHWAAANGERVDIY